jgi:phosphoribosyl 1,2-cyclic phosphodiesterase
VTHEHGDHVRGVGVLARRFGLPVYLSPGAAKALNGRLGKIADLRSFRPGEAFSLGGLKVHPFATSHDAADPVGFTLQAAGRRLGIATDLGVATNLVRHHLRNCAAVILETNHDPDLLMNGPYPWHLKQRVRGRSGHLSNGEARNLLLDVLHERLAHVVLGHLSEENNRPELALAPIREALDGRCPAATVRVAGQNEGSERLRLGDAEPGEGAD